MTRGRQDGLILLVLGIVTFVSIGAALECTIPHSSSSMVDFSAVYFGTRCLLEHRDPYRQSELEDVYRAAGGETPSESSTHRKAITFCINLPTTFIFLAPFAMIPWGPAHVLWMILIGGGIILAAVLMWNLGETRAPVVTGGLIGLLLANSVLLLEIGNTAGVVVSLCVIAVWCFLRERFALAGVLCLAFSLAIKPHDGGLVWLYFLLAGGLYRKRALQTMALTVVLGLAAILWITQVAPHWTQELQSNLQTTSAHFALNDPGPSSARTLDPNMVINLQAAISVFRDDPRIYNPASYLFCGALLLIWSVATLKSRLSPSRAWLALAAVVPLTMLVTYHRPHDATLLMLTVPACALLWAEGGLIGRLALAINAVGFVFVGTIPLAALLNLVKILHVTTDGLKGKILTEMLARPASLILLVMSIFYLWAYMRAVRDPLATEMSVRQNETPCTSTTE